MKQLDFYSAKTQELYEYLEIRIFEIIADKLRGQLGKDTANLAYWQVQALGEIGLINEETIRLLAEVTGVSEDVVRRAILSASDDAQLDVDGRLKHRPSVAENALIRERMDGLVSQATKNLDNLINQSIIGTGTASQIYTDIITKSVADVTIGIDTLDGAVAKTLNAWLDSGVPSGFVAKNGVRWNLQNYARTVINSTVNNAYRETTQLRAEQYDIHTVLVASHPQARLACTKIQGQVVDLRTVSTSGYRSIYDPYWEAYYGTAGGHGGVNCRHPHLIFDPEFHVNNMTQYDPAEALKADQVEARRKALANRIRKTKRKIIAYEALGDEARVASNKKLLGKQRAVMVQYVKDNDLRREYSLEKVIGP